jgi:hypothetical protein
MSRIVSLGNPGKCCVCGCSELKPCLFQVAQGEPLVPCSWIDPGKTLCSALRCIAVVPLDELERLLGVAA